MSKCIVFHAGALYHEYDGWPPVLCLPEGCYIRKEEEVFGSNLVFWYLTRNGTSFPIGEVDVPKEYLTMLLLMS